MNIDWTTFFAQIVNLLILAFLLKKFLYTPILRAIEARERKISERVNAAKILVEENKSERESLKKKQDNFERERYELLEKTKVEAEDMKAKMLSEARREIDKSKNIWADDIEREKEAFLDSLKEMIVKSFSKLADKTLQDLADESLEERIVTVFMEKMKTLNTVEKESFRKGAKETGEIRLTFAHRPSDSGARNLGDFLKKSLDLPGNTDVKTAVDPHLICGVLVTSGGKSISWNMQDNFGSFSQELKTALAGMEAG